MVLGGGVRVHSEGTFCVYSNNLITDDDGEEN